MKAKRSSYLVGFAPPSHSFTVRSQEALARRLPFGGKGQSLDRSTMAFEGSEVSPGGSLEGM